MKKLSILPACLFLFSIGLFGQQGNQSTFQGPLTLDQNIHRLEVNTDNNQETFLSGDRIVRTYDGALHTQRGMSIPAGGNNSVQKAKNYLISVWPSLKHTDNIDEVLVHHRTQSFTTGEVVTFVQRYQGLEVLDAL